MLWILCVWSHRWKNHATKVGLESLGGTEPWSMWVQMKQMVSLVGSWIILGRDMWHPKKDEIQYWVDFKALEFAWEESEGLVLNPTKWLERYLYTDFLEIFFLRVLYFVVWVVVEASNPTKKFPRKWTDIVESLVDSTNKKCEEPCVKGYWFLGRQYFGGIN